MVLVVVFGVALLVAVLLSGLAARTVLSTSLLFLVGGALVSDGFLGLIHIRPDSGIVSVTADLALFAVLFTDGMSPCPSCARTGRTRPAPWAPSSPRARSSPMSRRRRRRLSS